MVSQFESGLSIHPSAPKTGCPRHLAFSKRRENYEAGVELHFVFYNLCRVHGSLRMTPAVAAGVAGHIWKPMDLVL